MKTNKEMKITKTERKIWFIFHFKNYINLKKNIPSALNEIFNFYFDKVI